MATPAEALIKLRARPENFLKNYHVMTVRAMHQSGPTNFLFGGTGYVDIHTGNPVYNRTQRPGSILGTHHMHDSKNYKFSTDPADLIGTPAQVMAWHVDVSASAGIALGNIPSLAVSRNGGPDLMVTTLLNGCTFICEARANDVLMAHVQPTGGTTAAQLETDVINTGVLAGGGAAGSGIAFGGGRSYTANNNDVTIIGIRNGTQWQVFAQIHPRNVKSTVNVVEIFNG